ncbi:peptidoglycan recognition protein 1-like [Discoglossus pictus]
MEVVVVDSPPVESPSSFDLTVPLLQRLAIMPGPSQAVDYATAPPSPHSELLGTPTSQPLSPAGTQAKSIEGTHIRARGWCDIVYNFLIGEDGQIYEGRGWNATGAHAPGYNHRSIGISFMGTFTDRVPNSAAQNAAKKLIRCGVSKGYIKSTYILKGHRDVTSTQCLGNRFYKIIKKWRNFEA